MNETMVEVFSKQGRTVSIRSDLVDDWRANNVECPSCKGFGYHAFYEGGSLVGVAWSWSVWSSRPCHPCRATGFVRPVLSPTPAPKED